MEQVIDLSKRDYKVIGIKKKYIPLNYQNDTIEMLDGRYKFYSKVIHDLHLLYKNNKTNPDYITSRLKNGSYKNYLIKFDKKYDERPNREDFTEIPSKFEYRTLTQSPVTKLNELCTYIMTV